MRGSLSSFSYTSPSKNGNKHKEKFSVFLQFPLLHHITPTISAASVLSRYIALKEQYAIVPVILASLFCFLLQFLLQK